MNERFSTNGHYIYDNFKEDKYYPQAEIKEVVKIMNNLDKKARERGKALSKSDYQITQLTMYKKLFDEIRLLFKGLNSPYEMNSEDLEELFELIHGKVFDEKLGWIHLPIKEQE